MNNQKGNDNNTLKATITLLEMKSDPKLTYKAPEGTLALSKVRHMPVHFYRYLYNTVGEGYNWFERREYTDSQLAEIFMNKDLEVYVLYCYGVPAGYAELDFSMQPLAHLAYFGLLPDFTGRGFGKFLLSSAIEIAWARNISRLTVSTCTLDHPSALPLYQKCGFVPYERKEVVMPKIRQ